MHSAEFKEAKSTRGSKTIWWLLGRGLVDIGSRGYGGWLRIALRGNVSRIVVVLGWVGVWPKLRVVRRECGWIGMPILRMIGVMFAVVELQKIGRIHEEDELNEEEETKEEPRELFWNWWAERGGKMRARVCYYMCLSVIVLWV